MSSKETIIAALVQQQIVAVNTLPLLCISHNGLTDSTVLRARAEMEQRIKMMKATFFDLIEAGGPTELKALISEVSREYENAPYYDRLPSEDRQTDEQYDANMFRMQPSFGGRDMLDEYEPVDSVLAFARGDIIRTPIKNKRNQIWPAWFFVNEVITTPTEVKLRGWRLGEDQKSRKKYREIRNIKPDQYTYIDRRDVERAEVSLENF